MSEAARFPGTERTIRHLWIPFTLVGALAVLLLAQFLWGAERAQARPMPEAEGPGNSAGDDAGATEAAGIRVTEGFRVDLLYSVPRDTEGSWVSMAVDPDGRLITSDQAGPLYRLTLPAVDEAGPVEVEPIEVWLEDDEGRRLGEPIGSAQGLKHAFDALYVMVYSGAVGTGSGLYRLRDTTGDDSYDEAEHLLELIGGGEHGPHAIRLSPDGESLYILGGNFTEMPEYERSFVPDNWDEDLLLPRLWDPRGHAVGTMAPGGFIARVAPDGSNVEIISTGYRNPYDMAFNARGDLFTYDADMEWDIGAPWYRPTRVNHVTGGSELGWRSGSGKWPDYYPDSLPAFLDMGVGSPTGMCFGYGSAFPARYQRALFLCDWSFGELNVAWIEPEGSTYRAEEVEPFLAGTPLPLTAIRVNPHDGAMYFTTGGRGTQSGLYRITYTGDEPTDPIGPMEIEDPETAERHALRRQLERFHGREAEGAVEAAWPHLGHEDRFIRYAARIALEHQPVERWRSRALEATDPQVRIEAIVALARQGDDELQPALIDRLNRIDYPALSESQRLACLRAYQLVFARMGAPDPRLGREAAERLDPLYPGDSARENRELSRLAIYLEIPNAVERSITLMEEAGTTEEQIHYAKILRSAGFGWRPELRERYFEWFATVGHVRGGASFLGFIDTIREEAAGMLSEGEREALAGLLEADLEPEVPGLQMAGEVQREWSTDELVEAVGPREELRGVSFEEGRRAFGAAACFACHRVDGAGGVSGPDLTQVGRRFSVADLAEKIVNPNRNVSDQYTNTVFRLDDGTQVVGRIANLRHDSIQVITNPFAPGDLTSIDRDRIVEQDQSPYSPMPPGLVRMLDEEQVRALFAFMLSGGDPDHPAFGAADDG